MEPWGLVLVGVVIGVGIVGIVVPVLPGLALELAAVAAWAFVERTALAWVVLAVAVLLVVAGLVVKYLVPGRRLRDAGIPRRTLAAGVLLGVVGLFVIPVVGGPIGFVLGVYLSEKARLGAEAAWPSTRASIGAVGLSVAIEMVAGLVVATLWLLAVVVG